MEQRSKNRLSEEKRIKEITEIAESLIKKSGFRDLSLQECINASSISRATFFKYIPNKETLIAHIGIKGVNNWVKLMNKAQDYDGLARERLMILHATQVISSRLDHINYSGIFLANSQINRGEVSPHLNSIIDNRINLFVNFYADCILEAIKEGNLKIQGETKNSTTDIMDIAYFFWANRYGATVASVNYSPIVSSYDHRLSVKYKKFVDAHLDHMQWRPLSSEINYERVLIHIFKTYYAPQVKRIKAQIAKEANADRSNSLLNSITEQSFDTVIN